MTCRGYLPSSPLRHRQGCGGTRAGVLGEAPPKQRHRAWGVGRWCEYPQAIQGGGNLGQYRRGRWGGRSRGLFKRGECCKKVCILSFHPRSRLLGAGQGSYHLCIPSSLTTHTHTHTHTQRLPTHTSTHSHNLMHMHSVHTCEHIQVPPHVCSCIHTIDHMCVQTIHTVVHTSPCTHSHVLSCVHMCSHTHHAAPFAPSPGASQGRPH